VIPLLNKSEIRKLMNEIGGKRGRPPEFLSTHPAPEAQIREIESFIPGALKYYRDGSRWSPERG